MPEVQLPADYPEGPITMFDGAESTTWHPTDRSVNVADDKLEWFLANVTGSSVVSKPETTKKGK